jgi:hypothetical protein
VQSMPNRVRSASTLYNHHGLRFATSGKRISRRRRCVRRAKPGILTESMADVSMRNIHTAGLARRAGGTALDADEAKTSTIRRVYDLNPLLNPRTTLHSTNDVLTIATHSRLPLRG